MKQQKHPGAGKTTHILFIIGVLIKAVDGVLEIIGGILLIFVPPARLRGWIADLTQHELSEGSHDQVASFLYGFGSQISGSAHLFATIYLIVHGIVKVFLVVAMLRRYLWAYPVAIVIFILFIIYQIYRYTNTGGIWLIILSILDAIVILLIWLEFRRLRAA